MSFSLSEEEKAFLLQTARKSIAGSFAGKALELENPYPNLNESCGAFVTLHLQGELKGCIGHIFAHKPLFKEIIELAQASAFNDPRFPALKEAELPDVDIEISVLTPLRKVQSPSEVEVGKHGVFLQVGYRSGVLLPQVPVEQGWDREQYLHHLCLKAGMPGACLSEPGAELSVFEAIVFGEEKEQ